MKTRLIPECAGADPAPCPPEDVPPPGACDCHVHIFGPVEYYPFSRTRKYTPPQASLAAYYHVMETLGLMRAVIVQPSVYGFDNRATLDAIKAAGANFRGVAVIDPDNISHDELKRMHRIGIRGVRVNQAYDATIDMDYLLKTAEKIHPLGWHLQLFASLDKFPDFKRRLSGLPVDVVIDHMGHVAVEQGIAGKSFQDLLALLKQGKTWVKLSGPYRLSRQHGVPYSHATPFARALVDANPERCLWATDWPHPHMDGPVPNDGALLDLLSVWVPDAALRTKILVDNPARLYGFSCLAK